MAQITTLDCKLFIVKKFSETRPEEWVRGRKIKNENGLWVREFSHPNHPQVNVVEQKNRSLEFIETVNKLSKAMSLKIFTKEEKNTAKNILKTYFSDNYNQFEIDKYPDFENIKYTLPSIFNVCFSLTNNNNDPLIEKIKINGNTKLKILGENFNMGIGYQNSGFMVDDASESLLQYVFPSYIEGNGSEGGLCIGYATNLTINGLIDYFFSIGLEVKIDSVLFSCMNYDEDEDSSLIRHGQELERIIDNRYKQSESHSPE